MKKRFVMVAICAFAITLLAPDVWAGGKGHGTPDGETPANEGVCDILVEATPGLYGLCIAFCEAHDCEPDFSLADPFEGCKPASQKVLDNYNRKKTADDPDMPCIQQDAICPCWTMDELVFNLQRNLRDTVCYNNCYYNYRPGREDASVLTRIQESDYGAIPFSFVFHVRSSSSNYTCGFGQHCGDNSCPNLSRSFPITEEEMLACSQQLKEFSEEFGKPCF